MQTFQLFFSGIWSPGNKTDPPSILNRQNSSTSQPPTPPPPPFWSPKSAEHSPTFDRKEFRPVKFESPQLGRKVYTKEVRNEKQEIKRLWTPQCEVKF